MISVQQALQHLFVLAKPLAVEHIPLAGAAGRTLAQTVYAARTQPPFAASAMDGYAIHAGAAADGACFKVIGESAAGHGFDGTVNPGEAVRIFTGAPMPDATGHVVIQEDVTRAGDTITLSTTRDVASYVRKAGQDFMAGDPIVAPRVLGPADIALLAAMNIGTVPVYRKPVVAIIPTGDELVQPGEVPGPDQIIASNSYGLAALVAQFGGTPRLLPIARDTTESLALALDLAQGADLVITIGGASEGDHDLVGQAAADKGMARSFYKVAMRPGKPLMAGLLDGAVMIGLPGNPVSAMVCGHIFVGPVLRAMQGQPAVATPTSPAILDHPLPANGPREHYMRARLDDGKLTVFARQDSALLSVLSGANCLAVRPPHASESEKGDTLQIIPV